jgi:endonuclease/exonuclease/phosphatase family metal-dependent hydrolase
MQPLTVVSYNLRTSRAFDDHPWSVRREPLATLIRELAPTVLGTQEGDPETLADLAGLLPRHYSYLAEGRRGRMSDETSGIFYDHARLTVLDVAHRWLSDTPEVPGSASWGNELARMITRVRFVDSVLGATFVVINVHLDHRSEESRVRSAHWLAEQIAVIEEPVVLIGDFNVGTATPAYQVLINSGLRDALREVSSGGPAIGTFGDYRRPDPGSPQIDWILVGSGVGVVDAEIVDRTIDDRYPSDHLPVRAALTL